MVVGGGAGGERSEEGRERAFAASAAAVAVVIWARASVWAYGREFSTYMWLVGSAPPRLILRCGRAERARMRKQGKTLSLVCLLKK